MLALATAGMAGARDSFGHAFGGVSNSPIPVMWFPKMYKSASRVNLALSIRLASGSPSSQASGCRLAYELFWFVLAASGGCQIAPAHSYTQLKPTNCSKNFFFWGSVWSPYIERVQSLVLPRRRDVPTSEFNLRLGIDNCIKKPSCIMYYQA